MPENNAFPSIFDNPLATFFDAAKEQVGESLETIRHNFYIINTMLENGDNTMGGILVNQSGRQGFPMSGETKDKEENEYFRFLLAMNSIEQMELQLEAKYGEDFAEQLAAEHLDEDTYNRIMEIENKDERRREIAKALKEGIENGTIDPNDIKDPQIRDWVDARAKEEEYRQSVDLSGDKLTDSSPSAGAQEHASEKDENLSAGLNSFLA